LRYAASHRDETIKLTHDITGAKADDPRPAFLYDWAVKVGAIGADLPIPMDKIDYIQKMAVSVGSMPKPIDLKTVIDTSAREKALQLLAGH
jgi:NitT/TauT family transport system substrate-binding protein